MGDGTAMNFTLYHHGSSVCAAKVRMAMAEKEITWDGVYIDILAGEQFKPDYVKINPKSVVPTLIHDDLIIPDSTSSVNIWTTSPRTPACTRIKPTHGHRYVTGRKRSMKTCIPLAVR